MKRACGIALAVCAAVAWSGTTAPAGDVVGWRGDGSGSFPDATPPTEWSKTENVVWKTPMPAHSNASPVIVGDRILVCADPDTLICVNKADGKVLWSKPNDLKSIYSDEEWETVKKRQAELKALTGEYNKARGAERKIRSQLSLSTQKGRDRHTAGLKKRWERAKAAAEKKG